MKIDQIKMGSLLSYLSLILGTVVSLVYTPIMIERLGQSEYGVYSIVLPIVSESFQLRSGQCVHKILYKIQGSERQIQYGKAERYVPCHILPARRTCADSRIYDSRKSPSGIRSEADRRGDRECQKINFYRFAKRIWKNGDGNSWILSIFPEMLM